MVIDHIGIVVGSLEKGIEDWERNFGYGQMTDIVVNTRQGVRVVFLAKRDSLPVKLIQPVDEDSPQEREARDVKGVEGPDRRDLLPDALHVVHPEGDDEEREIADQEDQPGSSEAPPRVVPRERPDRVQLSPLNVHAAVCNLFNLGRHLISARHYQQLRESAFASWKCVAAL
jgi:hypothetical protein